MVDRRAVSSIVGVILIVGLTLATITAILAVGSGVLGDSQNDAHVYQMENAMSQMASKASLVGLDESDRQDFHLGGVGEGEVEVDPDAGSIKVIREYSDGSTDDLLSERPFGAVVYRFDGQEIAYQGGGVWRKYESGSSMLSPPEFHYKSRTLTFPIIRVAGSGDVSRSPSGSITLESSSDPVYPNGSNRNPLENGTVIVEIQSEYHWAWNNYFSQRTSAAIDHDPDNKTLRVDLTVPFEEEFDAAVTATQDNGIDVNGGDVPDGWEDGEEYPSASGVVQDQIDDCKAGNCTVKSSPIQGTLSNGTYFVDGSTTLDGVTFDTTSGDIDLVINGDLDPDGTISITGSNNVTVYINGSYVLQGSESVNNQSAAQFAMYFHSDSPGSPTINLKGNSNMVGAIYAPNSDAVIDGGADFTGSMIVNEFTDNGNPSSDIEYDNSLEDMEMKVKNPPDQIKFLHITDNKIEVEMD